MAYQNDTIKKITLPNGTTYDVSDTEAIHDPASKKADQILRYDGTAWIASDEQGGGGGGLTEDDFLTTADIDRITGNDIIWDGTVE